MWVWFWRHKVWMYAICIELMVLGLACTAPFALAAMYAVMGLVSIGLLRHVQQPISWFSGFARRSGT